jgi:hypothetical protein
MGKAGGIIGLIAGVFGVLAAIATLFLGGLGSAFGADKASTVVGLGWGGILFSFLVIVFGAVGISKHKIGGIGLLTFSLAGAILGGTIVAIFMALSMAGGVLCLIASKQQRRLSISLSDQHLSDQSSSLQPNRSAPPKLPSRSSANIKRWLYGGLAFASLLVVGVLIPGRSGKVLDGTSNPLAELAKSQPSDIQANGELARIFKLGSDYTDLQRDNKISEIKGQIVAWTLPVYEVQKDGGTYKVQTQSSLRSDQIGVFAYVSVRNTEERKFIETLKTGDLFPFKGIIKASSLRHLVIRPAVLNNGLYAGLETSEGLAKRSEAIDASSPSAVTASTAPSQPASVVPASGETSALATSDPNTQAQIATTWIAMSRTAMSITGDITVSPSEITISNMAYSLIASRDIDAEHLGDAGNIVSQSQPSSARLYKTNIPKVCGNDEAKWMLVVYNDTPGESYSHRLSLAFFSGNQEPSLDYNVVSVGHDLCGTFGYASK